MFMNNQRWNDRLFKVEMFSSCGDMREPFKATIETEQVCFRLGKSLSRSWQSQIKRIVCKCEGQKRRAE
jgi:hypothetical protein